MKHRNGDLFTTDAKIIAHGANITGVMGAGVAKTLRQKYPENYKGYRAFCKARLAVAGEWYANTGDDANRLILNLFTQDLPGPNAKYLWVFSSLDDFIEIADEHLDKYGKTIAIPEIGSGIGGLEWKKVQSVLETLETLHPDWEFEVWHYEG
jgi:O-acetyl-ADP-ribose deacetylase (regulator of RNase III)